MLEHSVRDTILAHFSGLPFWDHYWSSAAVAVVGSVGAECNDPLSDLDILVLVSCRDYQTLYRHYEEAIRQGQVRALNPQALRYGEFPITLIPRTDGHYKVQTFDQVQERIAAQDDITKWVHTNSIILHDPSGAYETLRRRASHYPEEILRGKLAHHYQQTCECMEAAKKQLKRDHQISVTLLVAHALSHLMRYCCLLDGRPYPYDKWLYQSAMQTTLGAEVKTHVDVLFDQMWQRGITVEEPAFYVRPGDRDQEFENYRVYHVWLRLKQELDATFWQKRQKG